MKHSLGANSHYRRRVHKTPEQLAQVQRDAQPGFLIYSFTCNGEPTQARSTAILRPPWEWLAAESVRQPRCRFALDDYFPIPMRLYDYCKAAGL